MDPNPDARDRTLPAPRISPWLAVAAFLLTLTMNGLAVWLPLAGRSTEAISAMFPVLITPAGFTFAVWSVIYLALAAFVVYQAAPRGRRDRGLRGIRAPFIASCLFNSAWLLAWHHLLIELSLVFMLGLLASLVLVYRRLGPRAPGRFDRHDALLRIPFGLYLAWITVATLVNARVVAYEWGWSGRGRTEEVATLLAIAAVTGLTLWVLARRGDLAFAAVTAWAFFGIRAANADRLPLTIGASVAIVVVVAAAVISLRRLAVGRGGSGRGAAPD